MKTKYENVEQVATRLLELCAIEPSDYPIEGELGIGVSDFMGNKDGVRIINNELEAKDLLIGILKTAHQVGYICSFYVCPDNREIMLETMAVFQENIDEGLDEEEIMEWGELTIVVYKD